MSWLYCLHMMLLVNNIGSLVRLATVEHLRYFDASLTHRIGTAVSRYSTAHKRQGVFQNLVNSELGLFTRYGIHPLPQGEKLDIIYEVPISHRRITEHFWLIMYLTSFSTKLSKQVSHTSSTIQIFRVHMISQALEHVLYRGQDFGAGLNTAVTRANVYYSKKFKIKD